jgi:formate dehydrogenase subunit gamma
MRRTLLALAALAPLLAVPALAQLPPATPGPQGPAEQPGAAARATTDPQVRQALPPPDQTSRQQPQENGAGPPRGTPELQGRVPESSGTGLNSQQQAPNSTVAPDPTGTPAAPQPEVAPRPVQPIPAPPPMGDRDQDAAEQELQRALHGGKISGRVSIPDEKAANLVQPAGRDWRVFHNRTLLWVSGVAVAGTVLLLGFFFLVRGRVRIRDGFSGRTMLRFNFFERAAHWMTASTFVVLALSGLNLTFGRHVLLPVIGPEAFTTLSHWGKTAHNFLAFPFTLGILLLFIMWVGGNLPTKGDLVWLAQGGGMIGSKHPKADRFNAGQKGIFWITVLGGAAVAVSGYLLVFPFYLVDVTGQQWAHMAHGIVSAVMMASILAHIYIGTLGMEGAFSAMGSGKVDYNWAREHHELWVEQELAKAHETIRPGSGPAPRPAGAD